MKQTLPLSYIKAFVAMSFWALTFVWIKIALRWYHPITTIFLRLVLASALMFLVCIVTRHKEKPKREDFFQFLLLAFFEPFCYFLGEANGMLYVSATFGSLIISTIPLVTALGAWLFLKEKVSLLLFLGLVISFSGVALLALASPDLWVTLKGLLLMMFAVISAMFYAITVRKLALRYTAITIVTWQSFFGMLYFLPVFLALDGKNFIQMQHSATGLLTIAGMSVFASVLAFLLFTGVIRELGVIRTNLFTYLIPVITAFLAFFILGDKPTGRTFLGIFLVISGLAISQYKDLRHVIIPPE